jgi:Zinc knuckle
MPEPSFKQKPNPEPLTSGDSNFESATASPAPEPTRNLIDMIEGGPQVETKQTWTKQVELIEGGPQINFEEEETHNLLVKSSYFTEPWPDQPYSPIENLFTNIRNFNWPLPINTITMAQPVAGPKELNLNKPEVFDGNQDGFKEFLQNIEVYMDINHENNLRKIAFVLLFMTTRAAATWKAQFIDDTYTTPIPANPNDRLGTNTQFRKYLMEVFSMFDSVGDTLDELRSLRKKKTESIDKHIAKFKMLVAGSKIDTTNPLSIKLFKETLPWALTPELMKLETLLKTISDWYEWAATLDHQFHKVNWAIERTRGNFGKERTPQRKYYFPWKEHDPNAMDVDRLTVEEQNKLMKEGRCFKCRNTGHQANECPKDDNDKKKGKEVPKKKMNGRELHAHVRALFKEMTKEDRDEFLKGAEEAGL